MDLFGWASRSTWVTLALAGGLAAVAIMLGVALKLTPGGAIALYFVVWWTMLFTVLPIRIRSQTEAGEIISGTDPGAPSSPALRERAIWTTVVADVVFVLVATFFPLAGL